MSKPLFLCIGAQKAGTSWLYSNLVQHPSIWMPPVKELHFFNHVFVPEHRGWTRWHIHNGVNRAIKWHVENHDKVDLAFLKYLTDLGTEELFTEAWYRRAFERPGAHGKITGDITPEYSTIPRQGIAYLRQLLGAVKIIYIIRNPVDRALSQIRMNMERRSIPKPNEEQWKEAIESWDVENRGDFKSYVPQWEAMFAPGDILFLNYLGLKSDPQATIRTVERFLGIEKYEGYADPNKVVHKTTKISIPDFVMKRLEEKFRPQTEFILERFGKDFIA